MDVQIDESRRNDPTRSIDDFVGGLRLVRPDRGDLIAVDEHRAIGHKLMARTGPAHYDAAVDPNLHVGFFLAVRSQR
jgi:hypothetical protein